MAALRPCRGRHLRFMKVDDKHPGVFQCMYFSKHLSSHVFIWGTLPEESWVGPSGPGKFKAGCHSEILKEE